MVMKIGRFNPISTARSGRNISVSTPRVHMPILVNPRRVRSSASELVETMVTAEALWKRRSTA
jgi:hypothetical protein